MKIGIVGSGTIVSVCLRTLYEIPSVTAVAMWHRSQDTQDAVALAAEYGIRRLYTDYSEFLKDDEIDVVYLGVINSLHFEFAKGALEAGKSVICEKPFTPNYWQAQELAQLATEKKLMLTEAVSFLHFPAFFSFRELAGKLKGIKTILSNYAQYSRRYDAYLAGEVLPAFDPKLCGGALYDINIYNINLIAALFGAPNKVTYSANMGFNGIDTSGVALLEYDEFKAVCCGAKDCQGDSRTVIQAANGYLQLEGPPNVFSHITASIDGIEYSIPGNQLATHMVSEFYEFERIFRERDYAAVQEQLTHVLTVMKIAERCRKDAGIVFPEDMW